MVEQVRMRVIFDPIVIFQCEFDLFSCSCSLASLEMNLTLSLTRLVREKCAPTSACTYARLIGDSKTLFLGNVFVGGVECRFGMNHLGARRDRQSSPITVPSRLASPNLASQPHMSGGPNSLIRLQAGIR
jgi:hypothetical protein